MYSSSGMKWNREVENSMKISNLKLKIIFLGTPPFIQPVLNKLEEKFEVVGKIREPKQWSNETIEQLNNLGPDLFVVAAYGQILPGELLSIPKFGAINIHPSLLPKYRGPSPIQSAILNGDAKTGVTFIKMDEELDHGPIIYQFEETILENDTFESLAKRLFEKSAKVLEHVIKLFTENQTLTPQDDSQATYTKQLTREDGYIDLSKFQISNFKFQIARRIRAYYPWPGVWTRYSLTSQKTLIKLLPNQQIQVEGKKPMSYKDFINGYEKGKFFLEKLSLI